MVNLFFDKILKIVVFFFFKILLGKNYISIVLVYGIYDLRGNVYFYFFKIIFGKM